MEIFIASPFFTPPFQKTFEDLWFKNNYVRGVCFVLCCSFLYFCLWDSIKAEEDFFF